MYTWLRKLFMQGDIKMKIKLFLSVLVATLAISFSYADCSFTYVNKSKHPVTLQGFFLDDGDAQTPEAWITVDSTRQITQVRTGKKCNSLYHKTGQITTRINLKNSTGYWIGNKGFLFASDRSYSHYSGAHAEADDGADISLSNAQKVSAKEFKVFICETSVDSDDCK